MGINQTKIITDEDGRKKVKKVPIPGGRFILEEMLLKDKETEDYREKVLRPTHKQVLNERIEMDLKYLVAYKKEQTELKSLSSSTTLRDSIKTRIQGQLNLMKYKIDETEKKLDKNASDFEEERYE